MIEFIALGLFTFNAFNTNIKVYEVNGIQDLIWHKSYHVTLYLRIHYWKPRIKHI